MKQNADTLDVTWVSSWNVGGQKWDATIPAGQICTSPFFLVQILGLVSFYVKSRSDSLSEVQKSIYKLLTILE